MSTNWNSTLTVMGDVAVRTNGTITHAGPFLETDQSNNIYIVCKNLTVDAGGAITADSRGYAGQLNLLGSGVRGQGPGWGGTAPNESSGGSHGGLGGKWQWYTHGPTYDSVTNPVLSGSSGGSDYVVTGYSGNGGGAIRIEALRRVTVYGRISADGTPALNVRKGGGAGGSVWLTCQLLQGDLNGWVRAKGGDQYPGTVSGAGGGGRVAIYSSVPGTNLVDLVISVTATVRPESVCTTPRGRSSTSGRCPRFGRPQRTQGAEPLRPLY